MSNKKLTFDWLPGAGEVDENNLQTPADTVKDLTLSEYGEIAQFVPGQATDFLADRDLAKRAAKAVNMEGERNAGDRERERDYDSRGDGKVRAVGGSLERRAERNASERRVFRAGDSRSRDWDRVFEQLGRFGPRGHRVVLDCGDGEFRMENRWI